jgi:Protein of unknown function (DUF3987)
VPERALPGGWLTSYVSHMRYSESPESFHFWTGVATIAGALRRKVWIEQLIYQYTPNFYIILVGPPGVAAKSTSMGQGLSLLKRVKDVHFGPQSLTWQALLDSLKNASTVTKIPGLKEPIISSCITVGASELGTFMRPENREYLDHLTSLWDGQKGDLGRKTLKDGQITIPNPWLNLIGCTTPSWLKDNFPDILIGGGLASRIVFVFADKKRQLVAYPARQAVDLNTWKAEEEALVYDLQSIAKFAGEYRLTESAYIWGEQWYEAHYDTPRTGHLASDRLQGYLARKQAHIHKLAIVLAASTRDELVIEESDLIEASGHMTLLEETMARVFDSIGVSHGAQALNDVLSVLKRYKKASYKSLFQLFAKTMDGDTFRRTILNGVEAGLIKKEPLPNSDWMLHFVEHKP